MSPADSNAAKMRTVRFHKYGEPADVLALEQASVPAPAAKRVRVVVHACGLNPADWALCRGLFPGNLPRGIGLDVAGVVDAIGEDVSDVAIGDRVFGTADFAGSPSAGAADRAILDRWSRIPAGLDFVKAGALPLSVETAHRSVDQLDVKAGQTFLVHGAGTTVGFAAVQIALLRGARVIATAGATNAQPLRTFGAEVTSYGEGMVERVLAIAKKPVDLILDTAPPSGALPELVTIAGGDPRRVLTVSDLAGAAAAGVRTTFGEANVKLRYDVLPDFAQRAADGKFSIPIAKTFPLEDWRAAMDLSLGGHARGKIMLLPTEG